MNAANAQAVPDHRESGRPYFDDIYAQHDDPYGLRTRWYERRKRDVLMAALPRPRFRRAYEPGCGAAELSAALASRCDALLCSDFHPRAVETAARRLSDQANVRVEQRTLPQDWPVSERFDLIVLSEVLYFLPRIDVARVAHCCAATLAADGVLAACDWRPDFDGRCTATAEVHRVLEGLGLYRVVRHEEDDFLMHVWQRERRSVAQQEGVR